MFTGIIEEVGKVIGIKRIGNSIFLKIQCRNILSDLEIKSSIAINGACLTVIEKGKDFFTVEVSSETQKRTNLGKIKIGDYVNLERAIKLGGRLDGHILLGHIDTTGKILEKKREGRGFLYKISYKDDIDKYIVNKGSIGVDGISLTILKTLDKSFYVYILPFTEEHTNLSKRKVGDIVNIEVDILAKYVEKLINKLGGTKDEI